jgi:putative SOS response-associated peptidase YedK
MCGRARLPTDYSELKIQLRLSDLAPAPNWRPSWSIAPTQGMFTVVRGNGDGDGDGDGAGRVPRIMRWDLIPSWSKDESERLAPRAVER